MDAETLTRANGLLSQITEVRHQLTALKEINNYSDSDKRSCHAFINRTGYSKQDPISIGYFLEFGMLAEYIQRLEQRLREMEITFESL